MRITEGKDGAGRHHPQAETENGGTTFLFRRPKKESRSAWGRGALTLGEAGAYEAEAVAVRAVMGHLVFQGDIGGV